MFSFKCYLGTREEPFLGSLAFGAFWIENSLKLYLFSLLHRGTEDLRLGDRLLIPVVAVEEFFNYSGQNRDFFIVELASAKAYPLPPAPVSITWSYGMAKRLEMCG